MHLNEGEIRAYQDQELASARSAEIEAHLISCPRCQAKAQAMQARVQCVEAHLSNLHAEDSLSPTSVKTARLHLEARLSQFEKEKQSMWSKLTSRMSRSAWAALAIVAILAVSLAFPSVRAVASSFLGLFRVEQISVVQVDTEKISHMESSSQLEYMLSEEVQFQSAGERQEVASAAEASALVDFAVRLPAELDGEQKLVVQPGGTANMTVKLDLVRAVLRDIQRTDIELPDELDGAVVELKIPTSVTAMYGECKSEEDFVLEEHQDPDGPVIRSTYSCTTLMQAPSPTISAPPGLDVAQIGEAYLQVLGLTREEAAQFARNVDWTTTFVIPIPRYGTEYQDVQVDGVTGALIEYSGGSMLIWLKDGILYALNSPGTGAEVLQIASTLK